MCLNLGRVLTINTTQDFQIFASVYTLKLTKETKLVHNKRGHNKHQAANKHLQC